MASLNFRVLRSRQQHPLAKEKRRETKATTPFGGDADSSRSRIDRLSFHLLSVEALRFEALRVESLSVKSLSVKALPVKAFRPALNFGFETNVNFF